MGVFLGLPILALAAVAQSTFAPQIQLLGGRPDLVFLLVLCWSINTSLDSAVAWAMIGGILQDLLSGLPTGTSALGMVPLVFGINNLSHQVYRVGFVLLVGLVIVGTVFKQFVELVILLLMGRSLSLIEIGYVVFPTLFYNLVFVWPIYWFVRRIQRRLGET